MEIIIILLTGLVLAILLATAIYDIKYQDVFLLAPLSIWVLALFKILVTDGGTIELLLASTSGLFLFVLGLLLYLTGGTGFGDALLFLGIGFFIGELHLSIMYLGFTMICFIPFFIIWILKYWKDPNCDITLNGFLKQVPVSDLKEGMVLSQSKRWQGITKDEIATLREAHKGKYKMWIKEGIPFSPAMFCGMIFILLI